MKTAAVAEQETVAETPPKTKRAKPRKPDVALVPTSQLPVRSETLIEALQRIASDKNIDVAKMRDIYVMHREEVAAAARVAYNKAMALCQQELPRVLRDAKNDSTSSKFARLETIDRLAKPIYTKHGFSLSFGTDESKLPNHYGVTCDVLHDVGHVEHKRADVPADALGMKGNPNKTATHAFGSTMSYARRYLTLLVFNIVLTNEDDDGNAAGGVQPLTDEQAAALDKLLERLAEIRKIEVSAIEEEFCKLFKIERVADLPSKAFKQGETQINQAIAALLKKGAGK